MRKASLALLAVLSGLLVSSAGCAAAEPASARLLQEGDAAPAFALPTAAGPEISLTDFRGRQAVLLYFSMGPG